MDIIHNLVSHAGTSLPPLAKWLLWLPSIQNIHCIIIINHC